jgi:hypothetical protein
MQHDVQEFLRVVSSADISISDDVCEWFMKNMTNMFQLLSGNLTLNVL